MAESQEGRTERISFALTPSELKALEFVRRIHPDRYEGTSSVLRDYSIAEAVRTFELAQPAKKTAGV